MIRSSTSSAAPAVSRKTPRWTRSLPGVALSVPCPCYGAFWDDEEAFRFARGLHPEDSRPSIEAQIMDWADDITYSIHDTEDFYRAGLIPLHLLRASPTEQDRFLDRAVARRERIGKPFAQPYPPCPSVPPGARCATASAGANVDRCCGISPRDRQSDTPVAIQFFAPTCFGVIDLARKPKDPTHLGTTHRGRFLSEW
jgi:hypothetical protein